jgi:hypothetical protein
MCKLWRAESLFEDRSSHLEGIVDAPLEAGERANHDDAQAQASREERVPEVREKEGGDKVTSSQASTPRHAAHPPIVFTMPLKIFHHVHDNTFTPHDAPAHLLDDVAHGGALLRVELGHQVVGGVRDLMGTRRRVGHTALVP